MKENIVFNLVRVQFDINNALKTEYPITDAKQLLELDDTLFDFRKDILEKCFTGNRFDFNKVLPIPNDIYQGDITTDILHQLQDYERWDVWCADHWDTMYNSFDEPARVSGEDEGVNILEFVFKSIGHVPVKVLDKFAQMYPQHYIYMVSQSGEVNKDGFRFIGMWNGPKPFESKYEVFKIEGEEIERRRNYLVKFMKYYDVEYDDTFEKEFHGNSAMFNNYPIEYFRNGINKAIINNFKEHGMMPLTPIKKTIDSVVDSYTLTTLSDITPSDIIYLLKKIIHPIKEYMLSYFKDKIHWYDVPDISIVWGDMDYSRNYPEKVAASDLYVKETTEVLGFDGELNIEHMYVDHYKSAKPELNGEYNTFKRVRFDVEIYLRNLEELCGGINGELSILEIIQSLIVSINDGLLYIMINNGILKEEDDGVYYEFISKVITDADSNNLLFTNRLNPMLLQYILTNKDRLFKNKAIEGGENNA